MQCRRAYIRCHFFLPYSTNPKFLDSLANFNTGGQILISVENCALEQYFYFYPFSILKNLLLVRLWVENNFWPELFLGAHEKKDMLSCGNKEPEEHQWGSSFYTHFTVWWGLSQSSWVRLNPSAEPGPLAPRKLATSELSNLPISREG